MYTEHGVNKSSAKTGVCVCLYFDLIFGHVPEE